MTKKHLALAASLITLVAISAPAFAGSNKVNAQTEMTSASGEQATRNFNASHAAMATDAAEIHSHAYHGGPKSND